MRRLILCLSCLFVISACTRPLTQSEAQLGAEIFGDSLDTSKVRIAAGYGLAPPPGPVPFRTVTVPRGDVTCIQEAKRSTGKRPPTAAFVRFQTIHYLNGWYRADLLDTGGASGVPLAHYLTFAHELVHVWQWQNRTTTGYHPLRAAAESLFDIDPYFYEVTADRPFAAYGYEQQGRMLGDYLCLRVAEPGHPQMAVLQQILGQVFKLD